MKEGVFYLLPLGDARGGRLCGRGVGGSGDGVMLTSENIVVLRASTLCLHSASKLLNYSFFISEATSFFIIHSKSA